MGRWLGWETRGYVMVLHLDCGMSIEEDVQGFSPPLSTKDQTSSKPVTPGQIQEKIALAGSLRDGTPSSGETSTVSHRRLIPIARRLRGWVKVPGVIGQEPFAEGVHDRSVIGAGHEAWIDAGGLGSVSALKYLAPSRPLDRRRALPAAARGNARERERRNLA